MRVPSLLPLITTLLLGPGCASLSTLEEARALPATSLRSMPLLVLDAGVRFAPPGPLRITALFSLEGRGAHVDLGGTLGLGLEL